ncbi:Hypothetical protein NTJ_11107 [Nesidiocoris tenuis]|uniref:Uncharacterized protein n=2 Tax=Nesidiocoris tenuis TaxID=355587 RepID=A0ABN7B1J1_9HEMI|nr:Hypothetical protein NTJ_11107 [Nesidiocoris tenuis]
MEDVYSGLAELGFGDFSPENLDDLLPKISTLISEDPTNPNFLQLVSAVFNQLASQIDVDSLESRLLKHVLPPTKSAFENSLSEVKGLLGESDTMDEEIAINISRLLQACLDILTGYGELLEVLAKESVKAENVSSLNRNLPPILVDAFVHCKESENAYGVYFEESASILTTFFRKSYEVQTKYYRILEEKIVFSSSFEDDFNCLVGVMEAIVRMSEIVTSLDIKTCVDQWKIYAKLYAKHVPHLKNVVDITRPLHLLINSSLQISNLILENQENSPEKQRLKLLKIGNFLLKMIMRLCELCEFNFRQGWDELLGLLLVLHSCTRTYDLNETVKDELRRFICVGAAPMLTLFVNEDEFFKAYHQVKNSHQDLTVASKIGLVFLSLSIMKNAVEGKTVEFWNSAALIELLFDLHDSAGLEIDWNSNFEGADAYSSMLSICAAYATCVIDESTLPSFENVLISKLFSGQLHTSVFVSDFLCLVGRLTSDQYCSQLVTYLCQGIKSWPNLSFDRPIYKIVGLTVNRLWKLLGVESKATLRSKFPIESSPHVYYWLQEPDQYGKISIEKFNSFCENPSTAAFVSLMSLSLPTDLPRSVHRGEVQRIVANFKKIVQFIRSKYTDSPEDTWLLKLLLHMLNMVAAFLKNGLIAPPSFAEILADLKLLTDVSDFPIILAIVGVFLSKSTDLTSLSLTPSIVRSLAAMLIKMLSSEDKFVVSTALEMLQNFKESSSSKEIVLLVSSHSQTLLNLINDHVNSDRSSKNLNFPKIIADFPRAEHVCRKRSPPKNLPKIEPPASKKLKIDPTPEANLNSYVETMLSCTSHLKTAHSRSGLSQNVKNQLKSIVRDLESICESTGASIDPLDISDIDFF